VPSADVEELPLDAQYADPVDGGIAPLAPFVLSVAIRAAAGAALKLVFMGLQNISKKNRPCLSETGV